METATTDPGTSSPRSTTGARSSTVGRSGWCRSPAPTPARWLARPGHHRRRVARAGQARRSLLLTPDRTDPGRLHGGARPATSVRGCSSRTTSRSPSTSCCRPYVLSSEVDVCEDATGTLVGAAAIAGAGRGRHADPIRATCRPRLVTRDRRCRRTLLVDVERCGAVADPPWRAADGRRLRRRVPSRPRPVWSDTIDLTKGCFLGQESVAKIRNLGHPPTVLRHLGSARRRSSRGRRVRRAATARRAGDERRAGSRRRAPSRIVAEVAWSAARCRAPRPPDGVARFLSTRRTSPFGSFPVPRPGVPRSTAFDPFRWRTLPLL